MVVVLALVFTTVQLLTSSLVKGDILHNDTTFICDSESNLCATNTINCINDKECLIYCESNYENITEVEEESCSISNPGCCDSIVYCPDNEECIIDCSYSCNGITVYANNSDSLLINNCNENCDGMKIYCPLNSILNNDNVSICEINGNSSIYSLDIYVLNGFNDITININDNGLYSSNIYCLDSDQNIETCNISPFNHNKCHQSDKYILTCFNPYNIISTSNINIRSTETFHNNDNNNYNSSITVNHSFDILFNMILVILSSILSCLTVILIIYIHLWINKKNNIGKTYEIKIEPGKPMDIHLINQPSMSLQACSPKNHNLVFNKSSYSSHALQNDSHSFTFNNSVPITRIIENDNDNDNISDNDNDNDNDIDIDLDIDDDDQKESILLNDKDDINSESDINIDILLEDIQTVVNTPKGFKKSNITIAIDENALDLGDYGSDIISDNNDDDINDDDDISIGEITKSIVTDTTDNDNDNDIKKIVRHHLMHQNSAAEGMDDIIVLHKRHHRRTTASI